ATLRGVATTAEDFARRFKQAFRPLWLVALGIVRDADWAEDVVQEAAVVALGKLQEFDPATSFLAWMAQIVRFVALNRSRAQARRRTADVEPDRQGAEDHPSRRFEVHPGGLLPEHQAAFDDHLTRGLAQLTPTARACLL